jgi:hypothetical protein
MMTVVGGRTTGMQVVADAKNFASHGMIDRGIRITIEVYLDNHPAAREAIEAMKKESVTVRTTGGARIGEMEETAEIPRIVRRISQLEILNTAEMTAKDLCGRENLKTGEVLGSMRETGLPIIRIVELALEIARQE